MAARIGATGEENRSANERTGQYAFSDLIEQISIGVHEALAGGAAPTIAALPSEPMPVRTDGGNVNAGA